jgi:DNA-binding NarL/FixJ family response regulator
VQAVINAGAAAYLLKDVRGRELAAAIREVHGGARLIGETLRRETAGQVIGEMLTARELEVLRLAACGHSNRQIGALLHIREATVKTHMSTIMVKLGASDRTHAVTIATLRGFIQP